jgi:hypothetical protein
LSIKMAENMNQKDIKAPKNNPDFTEFFILLNF